MTTNLRGVLLAIASGVFLTANDAVSKWLVPKYPVGQILFVTCVGVALLIWMISKSRSNTPISVNNWSTHLSRGLLFAVSAFSFITALEYLPLADTMCIAFAAPFFMSLMARFFLKEHVGLYRMSAVVVGFIGIVVVMQPGTPSFKWVYLLPLTVALSDASRDVLTRRMTLSESSLSMVFTTSITIAGIALLTLPAGWNPIQMIDFWLFVVKTCLMLIAYFLLIEAYRYAPTVVIAPFRYIQIIWGVLIGVLVWGDVPSSVMYAGLFLIVGSGVFIAFREARLKEIS